MRERPTDERFLTLLFDATGDYVPGARLEERLGVSRPALHQCAEKLRKLGYRIEARRHHGYRLVEEPEGLSALSLAAYRPLVLGAPEMFFLDEVDSTNSAAEKRLAEGVATPFAVIADHQTAGRGRFGRPWHAGVGESLLVSLAFRPRRAPREMPSITLWLGLAVARYLREALDLPVMVKWPNDLLLHGRKVAGMLTEARMDADQLRDLVFGLGLNLRGDPAAWPTEVRERATTLQAHLAPSLERSWSRETVRPLAALNQAYERFLEGPIGDDLVRLWPDFDALAGRTVTLAERDGPLTGTALGIDPEGRLRLRLADGHERTFAAGEVTLGRAAQPR